MSAFDVDGEPEHLELARRLLADYRGHERAMGSDPDADRRRATRARSARARRAGISLLANEFASVTSKDARLDAQRRGRLGDVLLGVGVGLAAASAITGVTLVARPKQAGSFAVSLRPTGVALEGRF